ncbi:TrmH family RNA methyltransferase [Chryseobacterium gotjawalense]|uniref:TrmH family RNA methyltransferase n=1 Tax=Chryseobacterium gotjawalense TaxID=3042315 RepID=A0ABY8RBF6_9FLAO|nr:TrmH family RNA methyltransferase [Chryseobacterium sp. wdc7]WHF50407.1 TrmH family RNA methyltransferase [Chryseobacterium sp. wdc7]
MIIESTQNEKIKYITRLISDNRFRKKENVFVIEGKQENERALQFGFNAQEFYIAESIFNENLPEGRVHLVTEKIYDKIAYRGSSEGILGIYHTKKSDLKDFKPKKNSSVIIVESIEKPGNLGAILRSCEAFGIDALIVTDTKVDFYNPNVIRSSVGCLFGMNIFSSSNDEVYEFLTENGYAVYTTIMDKASENIQVRNLKEKSAILFGTEHSGLTDFWVGKGKNTVIPMSGSIDSLNLSNAVAITCYEILRQKMA